VARDAIARQFDVDKNSVKLDIDSGRITFRARKGRSIDPGRLCSSLRATRLGGRTGMEVEWLQLDVRARPTEAGGELTLPRGTGGKRFVLKELPGGPAGKSQFQQLRESLGRGERVVSVSGRVEGWRGLFPDVLRKLEQEYASDRPTVLRVTGFQVQAR